MTPTGRLSRSEPRLQNLPVRTVEGSRILEQMRRGQEAMRLHHEKLLAAGFEWDGMDGYVAPPGFTEQQSRQLWEDSLREAGHGPQD